FVRVPRAQFRVAPWAAILVSVASQTTTQPDRAVTGRQTRSQKQATEEAGNSPREARYRGTLQRARATREQWSSGVSECWDANSFYYSCTPLIQVCLSNPEAAFALFKKRAQWRQIISAGLQRDRINIISAERSRKFRFKSSDQIRKNSSRPAV